jgi:hypothetical protein
MVRFVKAALAMTVSTLLVGSAALIPTANVFAMSVSGSAPFTTPQQIQAAANDRVDLKSDMAELNQIASQLALAHNLSARAQQEINSLSANGLSTKDLQTALDNFNAAVSDAQTNYNLASTYLANPNGYSNTDLTVNLGDAGATLNDIKRQLGEASAGLNNVIPQFEYIIRQDSLTNPALATQISLQKAGTLDVSPANVQQMLNYQAQYRSYIAMSSQINSEINYDKSVIPARINELINEMSAKGMSTKDLSGDLDNFNAAMITAQQQFGEAETYLSQHNGFNADGTISDLGNAGQTLAEINAKLSETQATLSSAESQINHWYGYFRGQL